MPVTLRVPRIGGLDPRAFTDFHFPGLARLLEFRPAVMTSEFEPGSYVLETNWHIIVAEGTVGRGPIEYFTDDVLFEDDFLLQATVEVLAEGGETVELVTDESIRAAMTESLKLRHCKVSKTYGGAQIMGWIEVQAPPMDCAFDVFLRVCEQEWPAGQIVGEVDGRLLRARMFNGHVANLNGDRVDLILRSSQNAARTTVGITRIWDGEIIIEDVALTPGR
jgi:hypothetical protein